MYDQGDQRRRQEDERSWEDPHPEEGTYDPSFRPPVRQPDANEEAMPAAPPPAEGREDFYQTPQGQPTDPYGRTYGSQAYHFAPPQPQYVYPPPYAYPYPYQYPYQQPVARPNTTLPVAGGILVLVASILSLIWYLIEWSVFWDFFFDTTTCFAIAITFSVIGLIGGILAMMRRVLPMAIIGAVFSMISVAFFGVSFVLGLVGLILIAIGYNAFHPQYEEWEAKHGGQYGGR
jgi:hypothetical protein